MDLLTLLAAFCLLFVHCASDEVHVHRFPNQNDAKLRAVSSLPRKPQLNEEARDAAPLNGFADKNVVPNDKNLMVEASSGDNPQEKQENVMRAKEKGEGSEWSDEGSNKSEYFTMDYPWVTRRRPIHNKQIPFVP